jgi:hypothetical protein
MERGLSLGRITKKTREKALGYLAKVLLGFGRGFKILPENDTKMLLKKL